jgi:hypothetical protein
MRDKPGRVGSVSSKLGQPNMGSVRGHQTQWAAQFAVASELCKRGYEVALTMGHATPIADLMAVSPQKKEMFLVDVKGLYRKNPWLIKRKPLRTNLFYILAYVPTDETNEFFVLPHKQVLKLINSELVRLQRPSEYPITGFVWKLALEYQNAWHLLPR